MSTGTSSTATGTDPSAATTAWLDEQLIWPEDHAVTDGEIRLAVGSCDACEQMSFPDVGSCTWCGTPTRPAALAGPGTATAATDVLHATPGSIVPVPYPVALVRFDSVGLEILGRVLTATAGADLARGTALRIVAETLSDGRRHYAFGTTSDTSA